MSRFAVNYGLEDADQIPTDVVDETVDSDEAAEAAVLADEPAVDQVATDIDTMETATADLQSICVGLAAMTRKGGVSRNAARFALNHADAILGKLGLENVKVAVEDFEDAPAEAELPVTAEPDADETDPVILETAAAEVGAADLQSIRVSIETIADIKARIKKIWESIKAAVVAFAKKVRDFVLKIFDYFNRVGKSAEALKTKLKALKNITTKESEVKLGGLKESFAVDGALATPADIAKMRSYLDPKVVKKSIDTSKKLATGISKAKTAEDMNKVIASANAKDAAKEQAKEIRMKEVSPGRMVSDLMPGNIGMYTTFGTGDNKSEASITGSWGIEKDAKAKDAPEKVPAPSKEDLIKYCDEVILLAKDALELRKYMGEADRAMDEANRSIEKLTATISGNSEAKPEDVAAATTTMRAISVASKAAYALNKALSSASFKVGRSALKFAKIGYNNFKEAEVESKKKAA